MIFITGPLYSGKRTYAKKLGGRQITDVQDLAADAQDLTALADEPGICLVTFGFTVTHGMDQIWLSAEVTV